MKAIITYYTIILVGYGWCLVEVLSLEPFDALVLFIVTFFLHNYRNNIVKDKN